MAEKQQTSTPARQEERSRSGALAPRWASGFGPFQRFADEMDRLFDEFGFGRGFFGPRFSRGWFNAPAGVARTGADLWNPDVEVFQRGDELVVRTDLPGLGKDDVKVDVTDDAIHIQGERHQEHQEEREGFYRSERSYGSFSRWIPLPEGALTDQAKASFKNGVLEITMPAPPEQVSRGRRLEIKEQKEAEK